jgi:hypothetical protein
VPEPTNVVLFERSYKWECEAKGCQRKAVADENGNIHMCRRHLEERHVKAK